MDPGDLILGDRGFLIEKIVKPSSIQVNVPPFTEVKKLQFEPHEVSLGRRIANTRNHVERAIGQIKEFKIQKNIISQLLPYLNEMFFICAMLTNFRKQLILK